mgnify:CR=1 FL=1
MKRTIALKIAAFALSAACASSDAQTAGEAPVARTAQDTALQWGACPPIFPAGCQIAVLHGDPGRPNADVFLRVPGGGYELRSQATRRDLRDVFCTR